MPGKYNPFRPDKIVSPGMFCGRYEEMDLIEHCLLQAKNENPQHFLIEGERGIGKSSLLLFEQLVACGNQKTLAGDKLNFIVINISLQDRDSLFSIIKRIMTDLKRQLAGREKFKSLALSTWEFITKIEAAGFRIRGEDKQQEDDELLGNLQSDFVRIISSFDETTDGMLLLIDEADRPDEGANLGLLCKLLTEELTRKQSDRLCIGLAGLPGLINKLKVSHESSPRIFRTMILKPLEDKERGEVIDKGMAEATERCNFEIKMTPNARKFISSLSEGYPHFLQEFAYCAYEEDIDNVIDQNDVTNSLFRENGAFDQLGRKFFDEFYDAPSSDDYRLVLKVMSGHLDDWVERATIIKDSGLKQGTVDNALRALKGRKIILQDEQKRGSYRLPTRSFAVWIKARQIVDANTNPGKDEPSLFETP